MEYLPRLPHFGDIKSSSSLQFQEFVPPSAWTEDETCHYLLVDLPGFKKHELKLEVADQTHIVVSGERQVSENKYKRFEQRFELPNNADVVKITGKLDGEILYISVPKVVEQKHQEIKHDIGHGGNMDTFDPTPTSTSAPTPAQLLDVDENGDDEDKHDDEKSDQNEDGSDNEDHKQDHERMKHRRASDNDWGHEADMILKLAIEKLRKNKGIVVTAIVAFSLGVMVSQKFQSNGQ
ncbi:uncharacterized protein [Rutidosis leptorrhynchoides]|uniref:uncharacterized protein n=1 Tax=Rutidosis leptorrhynchoides TaxID=125765 RepID=UPI003A995EB3